MNHLDKMEMQRPDVGEFIVVPGKGSPVAYVAPALVVAISGTTSLFVNDVAITATAHTAHVDNDINRRDLVLALALVEDAAVRLRTRIARIDGAS